MAIKLNAGDDVKRSDLFMVDPYQLVVKENLRGRHLPPTDDVILNMAISMMEHGQRQAVECRKIEDNKLLLVLGFTRTAAARLIRTGFTNPETGEEMKDDQFKLKCTITDANDTKAFINNIVENAHRKQTSPIDDAYNQHRLRDQYGYNDVDIRKLYQYSDSNKVGRYRRLLSLPQQAQTLVHDNRLSVQAALDLLDIQDEAAREAAFQKVYADCDANGKANGSDVRTLVRQHNLTDEDGDEEAQDSDAPSPEKEPSKNKAKPLSSREIRVYWENLATSHADENVQALAKTFLAWMAGKRTDKTLTKSIDALLDSERS
jgi:ParB-like chromosome segregation protein Spo0J